MRRIELYGLKIRGDIASGTDLARLIVGEARRQAGGIRGNDVIAITSKIISKAEGRVYRIEDVRPSRKARVLSKFYRTPPEVMEIYLRQGEIKAVIPVEKIWRKYGRLFEGHAQSKDAARKVILEHPYIFLIDVGGQLLTWGGVDFSNSPPGCCTVPPANPDRSAKKIRDRIRELTGKNVAIVISDTEWKLDKFGTVDIAIGSSGVLPVSRNFGGNDLYSKPKFGGVDDLTDLISASANLLFGQTGEATPVVILRGLKYEKSEKGVGDVTYSSELLREALRMSAWETIKFKLISKLLR